jgi:phosphoglycerol transferase MdoB-like AlkP superfamily enzyme
VYTLDIKRKDRLKILSAFHILIALIFLFDLSHTHMDGKKDWIFPAVYFISGIFLLVVGIFNKKFLTGLSKHLALLLFEFMLIISGAIYYWSKGASLVAVSHALLAGAIVLFWIYLKKRENGEKIIISEIDIILPGLAGDRIIEWNQLANVIKKHDLLTIDFKNNKLLQVQVINTDHIDEDEFNQFCQQQLKEKFKS